MPSNAWKVVLKDGVHTFSVEHGVFFRKFTVILDNNKVEPLDVVRVEKGNKLSFIALNHECTILIMNQGACEYNYDLILDGISVQTGRKIDLPPESKPEKTGCLREILGTIAGFIGLGLMELIFGSYADTIINLAFFLIILILGFHVLMCNLKHRQKR